MADTKISALPASTTPLAGTEVLPIVQSGVTKQVSVANLTAGRALSATELTLTTGNLIVANGQGVDFSATPGTGTSELLNDYEEGTWTPVPVASSGTITTVGTVSGTYTKIGRQVTIWATIAITNNGTGSGRLDVSGLPFTASATRHAGVGWNQGSAETLSAYVNPSATTAGVWRYNATYPLSSLDSIIFTVTYNV